jgi:hypothetical protein
MAMMIFAGVVVKRGARAAPGASAVRRDASGSTTRR